MAEIAGNLANAQVQDPNSLRQQAALSPLREQAQVFEGIADALGHRLQRAGRLETLLEQRLRLLQSRLKLDAIGETGAFARDPRVPELRSSIAEFLLQASQLRAQMTAIAGTTEADEEQRRQLGLQADNAVSRAFLLQNDMELILAAHWLDALNAVRDDDLMPLGVLRDAAATLAEIGTTLVRTGAALDDQRQALDSEHALVARQDQGDPARLDMVADLDRQVAEQQQGLDRLRKRLDAERLAYDRVIGERSAASLLEQRPLPATAEEWGRVAANARRLPGLAWGTVRELAAQVAEGVRAASPGQWAQAAFGSLLLSWGLLWGRRALARPGVDLLHPTRAALARVLPGLIPAGIWGIAGLALKIPADTLLPVVLLLLLWPVQSFSLDLARRALVTRSSSHADTGPNARTGTRLGARLAHRLGAGPAGDDFGPRFLRSLRLGLIPAVWVAALYILARTLPVAPILGDLLDRLAMLGLLTLALPAFAARWLLMHPGEDATPRVRRRAAFMARLSHILPVFLLLTGTLGILGFANLAWIMLSYFGWAVAVALGLAIALGLLSDLERFLDARLAAHGGDLESLWRTHFLEPGYRACQLAAGRPRRLGPFHALGLGRRDPGGALAARRTRHPTDQGRTGRIHPSRHPDRYAAGRRVPSGSEAGPSKSATTSPTAGYATRACAGPWQPSLSTW